jgi:hypothetical protein
VVWVHVKIPDPDGLLEVRVTLTMLSEHTVPASWDSATVPVKPLTAVTVIVEVPGEKMFIAAEDAVIVKSRKVNVNEAV